MEERKEAASADVLEIGRENPPHYRGGGKVKNSDSKWS